MRTELEKRRPVTPLAELVTDFMEMLRERLGLSCVALGPGCRDMEADLAWLKERTDKPFSGSSINKMVSLAGCQQSFRGGG